MVFPAKVMEKLARYPIGIKLWPLKALREFNGGNRFGEPRASQHEVDMKQVEAPSSMTVLCIPLPFEKKFTWNASWWEREGLHLSI